MRRMVMILAGIVIAGLGNAQEVVRLSLRLAPVIPGGRERLPLGPNLARGLGDAVLVYSPVNEQLLVIRDGRVTARNLGRIDRMDAAAGTFATLDTLHGVLQVYGKDGRLIKRLENPLFQKGQEVYVDSKGGVYLWIDGKGIRVWPSYDPGPFGIPDHYRPVHRVIRLDGAKFVMLEQPLSEHARVKTASMWYVGLGKRADAVRLIGSSRSGDLFVLVERVREDRVVEVQREVLQVRRGSGVVARFVPAKRRFSVEEEFFMCGEGVCQLVLGEDGARVVRLHKGGAR